jgi:glycosyltransferase involved in cell wall biosynthesis
MTRAPAPRRLVIVSHVVHYRHRGALYAYGPYSREIDIWADLFPEVIVAAPLRDGPPPADCLRLDRPNISIAPQVEAGGDGAAAKLKLALACPALVVRLACTLARADAIHVRCPGNLGLVAAVIAPLFGRPLVAKYAGQWNGYVAEPATVRFQRRVLRSGWWRGPVTVYGRWPGEPSHVVPFFTSMMTSQQVQRAADVARARRVHGAPLRVLYAGVLTPRKRICALIDALKLAADRGAALDAVIVGGGPEEETLRRRASDLGIARSVRFVGAVPFDEALRWYEWADCLVLPSRHSEGWPKVVAEAMTHGVIPIAVDHGQLRAMVEDRGILLSSGSADEIAGALTELAARPGDFLSMAQRAARWAGQYSLEGLRDALRLLLSSSWKVQLN